ncbi:MAG: aminotransferase class IV, partial [Chloroflexi bacterium]|nr:aminotransferase class IV [Chloroflexota bacterium]
DPGYEFMLEKEFVKISGGKSRRTVYKPYFVRRKAEMTGETLARAHEELNTMTGGHEISITLKHAGGERMAFLFNEYSGRNMAIVLDNTLLTPSLDSGILPGITRQTVLEMASSLGIKAVARKIALEELCRAQEAFLTNSAIEIMPPTCVGEQPIGRGQPGTLTRQLMDAYKETVRQSPQN